MYQVLDNKIVISVNDWIRAGLSYNQFNHDAKDGLLEIYRRGIHGNTLVDARSIRRPERRRVIEAAFGSIEQAQPRKDDIYTVVLDMEAREFFILYRKEDGSELTAQQINEYTNKASIFLAIRRGLQKQLNGYGKTSGKRLNMGSYWQKAAEWFLLQTGDFPCAPIGNARSLERAFKEYIKDGYTTFIHKNLGNDATRKVSFRTEKLLLALWVLHNKPFVSEVHAVYMDFIYGEKEFFDKHTGEVFNPEEFRYVPKGGGDPRPLEISVGTVWNYLKNHINDAAMAAKRDGNYVSVVEKRPYQFRKSPEWSLSKISMDDADLSRKMKGDRRVHRYMAYDVASGYWFTPVYSRDALTKEDVAQCMRNMFCEIELLGLPIPGEIEHEHHLVDGDIANMLGNIVRFVTASSHSRNKRAEHAIKALKWGVSHRNDHTQGRFFGKGSYRSIRFKERGEFKEKESEYDVLVGDDLKDIEEHNNSLHPLKNTYPGMTRRDVFLNRYNRSLPRLEPYYLYRHIGNETQTTICNNNHLQVNYEKYLIDSYDMLDRLRPGNAVVSAYWIPDGSGVVDRVYLYQEDTYIGSATSAANYRYNESKFEETPEDAAMRLAQDKRLAKFDKKMKDIRSDVPRLGIQDAKVSTVIAAVPVEIVETVMEEVNYCEYEYEYDAETLAIEQL
jgi:hypothetical protein